MVTLQYAPVPRRKHACVPDFQLDGIGHLAIHRTRKTRPAADLLHPQTRSGRTKRPARSRYTIDAEARSEVAQIRDVRFRTVGDISCTCPVASTAATPETSLPKPPPRPFPNAVPHAWTTAYRKRQWKSAKSKAISKLFFQTAHIYFKPEQHGKTICPCRVVCFIILANII